MKNLIIKRLQRSLLLLCMLLLCLPTLQSQELENYTQFKGRVVDMATNKGIESVSIEVRSSNISTITNSEGDFTIKVPNQEINNQVVFSALGYQPKEMLVSNISEVKKISLSVGFTELSEVNVTAFASAEALVRAVFKKTEKNNSSENTIMTAFYRETIKRRNRNVSLTEAVVNLYKQPYTSGQADVISLHKARKSTDYRRLDTVAVKLQGGPFSTLYIDIMKYPEYIFTDTSIGYYQYAFNPPSTINGQPVYVVSFVQKSGINEPFYQGTLYIDSQSLALTSADYSLNLDGKNMDNNFFVKKKPRDIEVKPLKAAYHVDYREKDGKWYYGYGSVELSFKINKKRRLFNQVYTLSSEMAVTDWKSNATNSKAPIKDRLRPSVVLSDKVSGFTDPEFWGPYNVIEPEKSIESAINKIQRRIKKS